MKKRWKITKNLKFSLLFFLLLFSPFTLVFLCFPLEDSRPNEEHKKAMKYLCTNQGSEVLKVINEKEKTRILHDSYQIPISLFPFVFFPSLLLSSHKHAGQGIQESPSIP
ncbi:hypothetical protein Dimus_039729 [Dionaea muscipula]